MLHVSCNTFPQGIRKVVDPQGIRKVVDLINMLYWHHRFDIPNTVELHVPQNLNGKRKIGKNRFVLHFWVFLTCRGEIFLCYYCDCFIFFEGVDIWIL